MINTIGIIIADEYEFDPFLDFAKQNNCTISTRRGHESVSFEIFGKNIIAVKCGIGKVNAASATAFLISDDKTDAILSIGLSGAISSLHKGDMVIGTSYVECDFDLTAIGYEHGKKPQSKYIYEADNALLAAAKKIDGLKEAKCGCGDLFLADADKKNFYKDTFGIHEFDMETGAIASVCNDASIPFIALRQISDTADDTAGDSYTEVNNKCEKKLTEAIIEVIKNI